MSGYVTSMLSTMDAHDVELLSREEYGRSLLAYAAPLLSFEEGMRLRLCECGVPLSQHAPLPRPKPLGRTSENNPYEGRRHGPKLHVRAGVNQRARTHCPAGHAYDAENTRLYRGHRYCRTCDRSRDQARRAAAKDQTLTFVIGERDGKKVPVLAKIEEGAS